MPYSTINNVVHAKYRSQSSLFYINKGSINVDKILDVLSFRLSKQKKYQISLTLPLSIAKVTLTETIGIR